MRATGRHGAMPLVGAGFKPARLAQPTAPTSGAALACLGALCHPNLGGFETRPYRNESTGRLAR